jgi:O-antigen ligase
MLVIFTVVFIAGFIIVHTWTNSVFATTLLINGFILVVIFTLTLLFKPKLALYASLLAINLPIGLVPPEIHSMLNRTLTMIAFVSWLWSIINRQQTVVFNVSIFLMICFIFLASSTLFWSNNVDRGLTVIQAYTLRLILFLFLITNEIRNEKDLDGLMNTLAISAWLLIIISVGALLYNGYVPGNRFQVLGENENGLGLQAIVAMPGILWLAIMPTKRFKVLKKLSAFMYLIMAMGFVFLSGSRGSAISVVVTIVLFLFWKPTRIYGKICIIFLILGIIFTPFIFQTTYERFLIDENTTLLGGRIILWETGLQIVKEHPLLGVGVGNAPHSVMHLLNVKANDLLGISIHNPVITIWAETGIVGLFLYLGVLVTAIYNFLKKFKHYNRKNCHWCCTYFAIIASIFIGYMTSWIKGGGVEVEHSYFFILSLLLIPSFPAIENIDQPINNLRKNANVKTLNY